MGITTGTLILLIVVPILILRVFRPVYQHSIRAKNFTPDNDNFRFSELLLISAATSGLLFLLFFRLSAWVWSFHKNIPISEFTPDIGSYTSEHDGIETFVLYILMLADLLLVLLFTWFLGKIKSKRVAYRSCLLLMAVISGYYFYNIGFFPPMESVDTNLVIPVCMTFLSVASYYLYKRNSFLAKLIVVGLIAFAGLISVGSCGMYDLAFILAPALRLMHGFKFTEIYFQYDIFLSLVALVWLKLNLALAWFSYFGWTSFFLLFIGLFYLSDSFFKSKGLSVFFIFALMIIRLYSNSPNIFQVMPLRLDLWLIPLLIVQRKGAYHWMLGICIGLLILFHRNLGLIYLGSYIELIIVLFFVEVAGLKQRHELTLSSAALLLVTHVKLSLINLILIGLSIVSCFIFFHELFSASALAYRQLGIGMLPIMSISFYWYVPILAGCLSVFLFFYGNKLGSKYFTTAIFIILLAIGNSVYFFGRSHENNILNISAVLVLMLFVFFDVLIFLFPEQQIFISFSKVTDVAPARGLTGDKRFLGGRVYFLLPVFAIMLSSYFYSKQIAGNLVVQYNKLLNAQIGTSLGNRYPGVPVLHKLTRNSSKVYFLDFGDDFYYYYYGKYAPVGYYSPCASWIYKKEMTKFMQDLLDDGYYIVYNNLNNKTLDPYVLSLKYDQTYQSGEMIALKRENVPLLLPESMPAQYHIGIKDSLGAAGLDHAGLALGDKFMIEVLVKPSGTQLKDAMILNNVDGLNGFSFQQSGDSQSHYVFALLNGTAAIPRLYFHMDNERWNYIAFVVNKKYLRIYNNGMLVASLDSGLNSGLKPYANSDIPITIGNRSSRQNKFTGYIREVKFSNGNIPENEIIAVGKKLDTDLNTMELPAAK